MLRLPDHSPEAAGVLEHGITDSDRQVEFILIQWPDTATQQLLNELMTVEFMRDVATETIQAHNNVTSAELLTRLHDLEANTCSAYMEIQPISAQTLRLMEWENRTQTEKWHVDHLPKDDKGRPCFWGTKYTPVNPAFLMNSGKVPVSSPDNLKLATFCFTEGRLLQGSP